MEIPHTWQRMLGDIQDAGVDAVIIGGALRDIDNGREVKEGKA